MTLRTAPWLLLLLLLPSLGLALPAVPAHAEEDPKGESSKGEDGKGEGEAGADEPERSPLGAADDKNAKALAAELKKVGKKKNSSVILPVLEKLADLEHKDFDKPLLKLLKHESSLVALKVADMWEWRLRDKKLASKLWKASWGEKKNDRRYAVKAKTLKAFARGGIALDGKQFKDVERAWRWIVGNPDPRHAPALSAMADWVRLSKDKRLFRRLAEELDEPGTDNPNAPSNPPASWWEKRWKLWKDAKPAVVEALQAITGKEFDKSAEAKAWFDANGKKAGFEW